MVRIPGLVMVLVAVLGSITIGADLAGEKEEREMYKFPVTWGAGMETLPEDAGNIQDGGSTEVRIAIDDRNLTTVVFKLGWSDNLRFLGTFFPPEVTFRVTDPNGTVIDELSSSSQGSEMKVTASEINTPNNITEIEAGSDEAARKEFSDQCPAKDAGTGTWTVTISTERSIPRMPMGRGSIDYTLTCDISYFYAELGEGGKGQG